jgi:hypothetical protein
MGKHDVNILIRARDDASSALRRVARTAVGLGAAFVGFRQISRLVSGSLAAYNEEAEAVNQLGAALTQLGAGAQLEGMRQFAASIQKMTTVGDEATLQMMQLGATVGQLTGDGLQEASVAAIGLSRAFKMDLEAAMRLVARAAVGETGQLKRYGIVLADTADKTAQFNELLAIGRRHFALAQAETQTFSGKWKQLSNAIGDAKEQLGAMIAENGTLMTTLDLAKQFMENIKGTAELMWLEMRLGLVRFQEDVRHALLDSARLAGEVAKRLSIKGGLDQLAGIWGMIAKGEPFSWSKLFGWEGFGDASPRPVSALETQMAEQARQLADRLTQVMLGTPGLAGRTGTTAGPAALAQAQAARGLAAVEGRFLAGSTPTIDYQKETALSAKKQERLLAQMTAALTQLVAQTRPGTSGSVAVAQL